MTYADFWKEKRVAVVGLGPEGEMRADAKFLLKHGARVTAYDMRGKPILSRIVSDLKAAGLESWRLGLEESSKWAEELAGFDVVLLDPRIPRSAEFLKHARTAGAAIEYPDILTLKLSPAVTVVGAMGSSGKSAVIAMLSAALRRGLPAQGLPRPVVLDLESPAGSLALLPKIRKGGVVIVRMPDHLLSEYARSRQSPQVAVMAALPAVREPFAALAFQTYNNFLVTTDVIADRLHAAGGEGVKAKIIRTRRSRLPDDWDFGDCGDHEREDAALVIEAAALFKVDEKSCRPAIEQYAASRQAAALRLVKRLKGVGFYNDAASERPEATLAAVKTLAGRQGAPLRGTVLIMGGASTEADYDPFLENLPQYVGSVVLVPGSGTSSIRKSLASLEHLKCLSAPTLESALKLARAEAPAGGSVLYSPAFATGGIDQSRSARSERYVKAVRGLW